MSGFPDCFKTDAHGSFVAAYEFAFGGFAEDYCAGGQGEVVGGSHSYAADFFADDVED